MTQCRLRIFKLYGLLLKETEGTLSDTKLTRSRSLVIGTIVKAEKAMTIAHEMGQTRQGISRLVSSLVADGYLFFSENPYHRNSKLVNVSPEGIAAYKKALKLHIKLSQEHPFPVDDASLAQTCDVLAKIIEHLENNTTAY